VAGNGQSIEARSRRQSCLVVDDQPAILAALEATLSPEYACHLAQDSLTALSLLQRYRIDLILLDLILNDGLNGIELLRRIRRRHPAVPVLIMTGCSTQEFAEAAASLHVWGYIKKPFNFEEVRECVRLILSWQMIPRPCGGPSDGQQLTSLAHSARRFINERAMKVSTVEEVAKEFGVSARQLSDAFRNVWGVSPKEYIIGVRIEKSKELLSDTDRSVKSVALTLRFQDSSHYNKQFRRVTGLTPSEFRRPIKRQAPPASAL
jgi:YesN/AraC family two-component response regulator